MSPRQQRAAWAAVVVLGVLLPFAPAVVGLRTLSYRDTDRLYAPVRTLVVEALRDLRLPLWNPYELTGKPLFAEGLHSVLHPLSLLAALVAPSSIDFLILAYLVAAALGAFVLARTLEASEPASAGTGLAFALSGYSVSMTGNLVFLAGLSSLPWLLAAARSAGRGDRWGIVLTALATATAFFSGDVQVTLVGLALGTLLAWDAGGLRGAARALAGFAPGILLAAVQILASYELMPLSLRGQALDEAERTKWSLVPCRLLEWFIPGLRRGDPSRMPVGVSGEWLPLDFSESVYLGAPLLLAAALGAVSLSSSARRRTGLLLLGATATLLWLALGHHLGARQLLDWVPVWNRFRYSEKLMAPIALCLATMAASGIDAFAAGRLRRGWAIGLLAASAVTLPLLTYLLVAPDAADALALRLLGDFGPFYRSTLAWGLPHLLTALVALLAIDRLSAGGHRAAALGLLVALLPAAAVYRGAQLGSPEARSRETPFRFEGAGPVPRVAHASHKRFSPVEMLDFADATARVITRTLIPVANVAARVDALDDYGGFRPLRATGFAYSLGEPWALILRRFALTHVVVGIPHEELYREAVELATEGAHLLQREPEEGFELWAVPHRPWAFFARHVVVAATPPEARTALMELIVTGDETTVVTEATAPSPTAPGRVLTVERGLETVRLEAESLGPALLVVQDAFWPGWRASIDGQPAEILAADYLVRAVRWPAGRHTLEMAYDPPEIRTGLALSGLGALVILALAALAARLPRRPAARDDALTEPTA